MYNRFPVAWGLNSLTPQLVQCVKAVQERNRLHKLHIAIKDEQSEATETVSHLLECLQAVKSQKYLRELNLELWPKRTESLVTYGRSQNSFLDMLFCHQTYEILEGFPELCQLRLSVEEHDMGVHDEIWWREQMISRTPQRLRTGVSVSLKVIEGVCRSAKS